MREGVREESLSYAPASAGASSGLLLRRCAPTGPCGRAVALASPAARDERNTAPSSIGCPRTGPAEARQGRLPARSGCS